VLDFLTARYGQFVLLKPRFGWDTALLWGAPAGVLLVGGLAILLALQRRKDLSVPVTTPLTDDETRRLEELTGR
jgi:cytochrome c-type biogenesis protein CcmH